MKYYQFIEKYFWIFSSTGLLMGLVCPIKNDSLMLLLKPFLMLMLFFVLLKTDIAYIFHLTKQYKLILFIVTMNMIGIPLLLYWIIDLFNPILAIGILLITAMPAGVTTPALTDIVKGNTALSASIVISTTIIAPFTVPLVFLMIHNDLSINSWLLFKDLIVLIFVPMLISQSVKKYLPKFIDAKVFLFTSINILLLSLMIFIIFSSYRSVMLGYSLKIFWYIGFLYIIFIILHLFGFLIGLREDRKGKIAITIGSSYLNIGMAIVLAVEYFEPFILALAVFAELPWYTLLFPYKKFLAYKDRINLKK